MNRKFQFAFGEFYHIYNRGADKRDIFLDDWDRHRFLNLLYLCNNTESVNFRQVRDIDKCSTDKLVKIYDLPKKDTIVDIGSYCLMSNHFHLLLHEKVDGGITTFLRKLSTAYSMFFNKKYNRTGSLFEGKFKAAHVDSDDYMEYLFAYIHLNPVKIIEPRWKEIGLLDVVGAKAHLDQYKYSSYLDYVGAVRDQSKILNRGIFPDYFSTPKEHRDFVDFWITQESVFGQEEEARNKLST